MTTLTVVGYSNMGEPYIVPFKCEPGTEWCDETQRCEVPTGIPSEQTEVIALIRFTQVDKIVGVCRHALFQNCCLNTGDGRMVSISNGYRSLYIDINEN